MQEALRFVRKWLGLTPERTKQHGAVAVWQWYQPFEKALPTICADPNINMTVNELKGSFTEYIQVMKNFIVELDTRRLIK